jgi:hypothetical protein
LTGIPRVRAAGRFATALDALVDDEEPGKEN